METEPVTQRVADTPSSEQESVGIRTFHAETEKAVENEAAEEMSDDVTDAVFEAVLRESAANVAFKEQAELEHAKASTIVPGPGDEQMSFSAMASEEPPLLGAAYQQISVLNTQLAHLYTELTMARTEAASLKADKEAEAGGGASTANADKTAEALQLAQTESQRQAQQIADLVSDIRHLQLDLEYHQQKVDQLLEEKQIMMKDMKALQQEVAEARQQLEEKDQLLKHQEVDLLHHRQREQQSPRGGKESDDGILDALRTEAAAKDSALIVSHYELHKEKLMRDRLEQKNLKLMERMQKLMMVVETMRKDNVNLERSLQSKDRMYEEKDAQLRIIMQKVRQLQKTKGGKPKAASKAKAPALELEGSQNLPPLDSARRGGSASGRRSGQSTPRRNGSPYTTRA
ncbi:unnamed protein product [Effrenium voratum]|uniref:Uncharacterized protein n=1 Tax=Effrenium voratum TaxID=2562239 RepID=A0AA36NBC9_9DINO|nr:unnamed protein product [Effrenium voratum]